MDQYKMIADSSAEALAEKVFKNASELAQTIATNIANKTAIEVNTNLEAVQSKLADDEININKNTNGIASAKAELQNSIANLNNSLMSYLQRTELASAIQGLIASSLLYEEHKDQEDSDQYPDIGLHVIIKSELDTMLTAMKESMYAALGNVLEQAYKTHKVKVADLEKDFLDFCKKDTEKYTFASNPTEDTYITFTDAE